MVHICALRFFGRAASLRAGVLPLIAAVLFSASDATVQSQPSRFMPQWEPYPSSPLTQPASSQPPWQTPVSSPRWGVPASEPSMRFVHVVSAHAGCAPDCAEWVSAEGKIEVGTAQTFARFIAGLGGRRLPILINSHGGSASDAMAMGRLIRAQRLVVVAARTELSPCPTVTPNCSATPGIATAFRAQCLSACSLVLAGGVERYVNALAAVGVHQIKLGPKTMVMRHYLVQYRIVDGKKEEISRSLTSQEQYTVDPNANDLSNADSTVARYMMGMGVGDPVMSLMLATPPSSIHVMTQAELASSRLATMWTTEPPFALAAGPMGLAGFPIGLSSPLAGTFAVATQWPMLGAIDGRPVALAGLFQYRPGGGAIYAVVSLVDMTSGAGFPRAALGSYILANGKDAPLRFDERGDGFAAAGWISRDAFCRLRGSRRAFVEFAEPSFGQSDERRREHLARVDIATAPGAAALFAEACPAPSVAARR
jgi:hypothetical protein